MNKFANSRFLLLTLVVFLLGAGAVVIAVERTEATAIASQSWATIATEQSLAAD